MIVRIHTIRETSFISSGYLIAELTTALLSLALILSRMEPFYESLFIVGVIVFLLAFLLLLIGDLDNPFGYYEKTSSEEVSLKPLEDAMARMGTPTETREKGEAVNASSLALELTRCHVLWKSIPLAQTRFLIWK